MVDDTVITVIGERIRQNSFILYSLKTARGRGSVGGAARSSRHAFALCRSPHFSRALHLSDE
jgi:hypothetical protein